MGLPPTSDPHSGIQEPLNLGHDVGCMPSPNNIDFQFLDMDFEGCDGENRGLEDFIVGGGGINDNVGMDTTKVGPSNIRGHVRGTVGNEVRNNRNIMHLDGDNGGPILVPTRRWTNHCGRVEMDDGDSEDFL